MGSCASKQKTQTEIKIKSPKQSQWMNESGCIDKQAFEKKIIFSDNIEFYKNLTKNSSKLNFEVNSNSPPGYTPFLSNSDKKNLYK